jgi:hypothetical protein
MNAVEIEDAVVQLVSNPFDVSAFPFAFLEAFGNKATTIAKLKSGASNGSDVPGGVLQRNHIHMAVCTPGTTGKTLDALRESVATKLARNKVRLLLATDGEFVEAEDLTLGETAAFSYSDFPKRFTFFLPLAGISTTKQLRENAFDISATGRLNKLYLTLRQDNPDWDKAERRHDMNHFMARLIFCFFAESTDIFNGEGLFTQTIEQITERDGSNTHEVIGTLFRAMNLKWEAPERNGMPTWSHGFPYVNGELFSGSLDVPRFSRIARAHLLHIGKLDWKRINPDIFGSMIQAVADDDERSNIGMHYTSVPNILKVLNPLFLDNLREQLAEAADNARKLLNLRNRMARIRVFDPACGSGNFLVIAYKEMREIEAEINKRRGEPDRKTDIPLTNFRGIELKDFPAEIARLALIIAEYQCDVIYRGQKEALKDFLPLDAENWITCGNALRIDWLSVCPPTGTGVKLRGDDLFSTPLDQAQIDFENTGGETYICGNPPYYGSRRQEESQKEDLCAIAGIQIKKWKSLDYVAGWLIRESIFADIEPCKFSFVCTSSVSEGIQVALIWPIILGDKRQIYFAHRPFKWKNLAKGNAGVTVVIIGVSDLNNKEIRRIYDEESIIKTENINGYLSPSKNIVIETRNYPIADLPRMVMGSMPRDGGNLIMNYDDATKICNQYLKTRKWIKKYKGSYEIINALERYCLWIPDSDADESKQIPAIKARLDLVTQMRYSSSLDSTNEFADRPHRFVYLAGESKKSLIAIPGVSSEERPFLPVTLIDKNTVVSNAAFAIYDADAFYFALIASRLHLVWIATVCGRLKTDFRYSNTLGWNTFPVPPLLAEHKEALTRCAEDILLAREAHWPATIADLYDPDAMPDDLRAAHDRNDETLERIYIGRRFRNDTERLEKLFEMYTKMTAAEAKKPGKRKAG